MDNLEKLTNQIMRECEAEGEPVTEAEAREMAEMEIKSKGIKRYEQAEVKPARKPRERKADKEKGLILSDVRDLIETMGGINIEMKTETEIKFGFGNNSYTLKLTKHRNKKQR